ncbi:hypothetical protein D083_4481 [Dickeya solani RNS 08.23.3.1.A]|nr:hypothetical protein D083_4481 [Dickeya solani RNS 08.23.3.1.A]
MPQFRVPVNQSVYDLKSCRQKVNTEREMDVNMSVSGKADSMPDCHIGHTR